jgi:small basic protein
MHEQTTPTAAIEASALSMRSGAATRDVSLRRAAIVAGLGLLVMFLLAFSGFSAFESLVVEGDATRTARNIADHELLFRIITCSFVIVAGLDVLVAWALYVLLRPVNQSIALLSAWLRVAYAAVFAAALSNLVVAVSLQTDVDSVNAFGTRQLNAQVMTSVNEFKDGWNVALAIFGLHLLVLGYLVFRSNYIPSVLGILVTIASLGYLIDSFGGFLSASYDANVAVSTFPGEVLLMGWLLWRGRRLQAPTSP